MVLFSFLVSLVTRRDLQVAVVVLLLILPIVGVMWWHDKPEYVEAVHRQGNILAAQEAQEAKEKAVKKTATVEKPRASSQSATQASKESAPNPAPVPQQPAAAEQPATPTHSPATKELPSDSYANNVQSTPKTEQSAPAEEQREQPAADRSTWGFADEQTARHSNSRMDRRGMSTGKKAGIIAGSAGIGALAGALIDKNNRGRGAAIGTGFGVAVGGGYVAGKSSGNKGGYKSPFTPHAAN